MSRLTWEKLKEAHGLYVSVARWVARQGGAAEALGRALFAEDGDWLVPWSEVPHCDRVPVVRLLRLRAAEYRMESEAALWTGWDGTSDPIEIGHLEAPAWWKGTLADALDAAADEAERLAKDVDVKLNRE